MFAAAGGAVSRKNIGAAAGSALSSGKDSVRDVLVMENVLYAANTTCIYDLKGSECSRWSQEDPTQALAGAVLMDDNLRGNNLTQPILVSSFHLHIPMAPAALQLLTQCASVHNTLACASHKLSCTV